MSEPTLRMKRLYHYLIEHRWGEPTDLIVFDGSQSATPGVLEQVHVGIWDPDSDCDVMSFITLGMSELIIPFAEYRAELTLGFRGCPSPEERRKLAAFLANITEYPFMYRRRVDWWERLTHPGEIPA